MKWTHLTMVCLCWLGTGLTHADTLEADAGTAYQIGEFWRAQTLYEQALAADPDRPDLRVRLAESLFYQDQLERAELLIQEVLAADAQNISALLMMARLKARAGDDEGSGAYYQSVLDQDPVNGEALLGLGNALSAQGDETGADALFAQYQALQN